jgi:serine protease AprX
MQQRPSITGRLAGALCALIIAVCAFAGAARAATLGPSLADRLDQLSDGASVGVVIVAFHTNSGLTDAHLNVLRAVGVTGGRTLPTLGMVAFPATVAQVRALAADGAVRSIWPNEKLDYHDHQARTLGGVERVRTDSAFTTLNGGLPLSGRGDFAVVINDSGIDATHNDLKFGEHVVQNVQLVTDSETLAGFTTLQAVENVPNTDLNIGHGTHCAGIVGGTGQMSGGLYAGVAPGAKLIGTGSGAVLFVLNALGGFEWSLANQFRYGIRIISNSFGSDGAFNADDPLNIATRAAYERNIVVVFSASNSGPGRDTHNRYGKAPWVISVGAGTKEGGLADFSSRGVPKEERLADADPNNDFDAPTIVAPGTGREFASNAGKFTAAYVAARSTVNLFANGLTDDTELSPAHLPYYTQISGTSMACPYVAGVAALMLDADPTLTPDQIKQTLVETATRMPGYEEYEVGAGYVNVYAAVDKVFRRAKSYGTFSHPTFNQRISVTGPAPEQFRINYSPAASGQTSTNARNFTVGQGIDVLSAFAAFPDAGTGDGNTLAVRLYAPDGTTYSSSVSIPILDPPNREVVVKNPLAGQWTVEMRGLQGRAALPGPVDMKITQQRFILAPVADIQGHASQAAIEFALKNRMMDVFADLTFRPNANVTRADFANTLFFNAPVRQSLGATPKFTDVSGGLAALAEALTANGSTLRDWDFTPQGLMSASGSTFNPTGVVNRLDLAVAFVRALGHDAEARAKANTVVTWQGQPLSDNAQIPGALRGYVQLALDKGLLEAFPAEVRQTAPGQFVALPGPRFEPGVAVTRATLAVKLGAFRQLFTTGG